MRGGCVSISPALAEVNVCLKLAHEALQLQAQLGWQPVLHEGWIVSVRQHVCHRQACKLDCIDGQSVPSLPGEEERALQEQHM